MLAAVSAGTEPTIARRLGAITSPLRGAGASIAILRRELVVTLRGWRAAFVVALMCALATYLLLAFWPPPGTDLREIGDAPVKIVLAVSLVLLGASYVALPGLAANAILGERQQQTFDLLKLSLIPPFWVVFAKLMNCVGFFALMLAATIPILAASFYLVGVDIQQFGAIMLMLIVHAFACSAAGLAASAYARRPFSAIVLSYFLLAVCSGIPTALANEYLHMVQQKTAFLACPGAAILSMLFGVTSLAEFLYAIPIQLALFAFFFCITMVLVRRPERVVREDQSTIIDDPAELDARRKQFPFYLIDPLRRRPDIPDGKNPMRIKELRWGLLGRETRMVRVCYMTMTIMFFFSIFSAEMVHYWVMVQFAMLLMFAPAFVASAVSKEYEQGNMDLLRITLLDGRDLMQGKFWAAALSLVPFLTGLFLGGLPMFIYHLFVMKNESINRASIVLQFYPMLLSFTGLVLACGLFFSVLYRRTVAATVSSYATLGLVLFAAPGWLLFAPNSTVESIELAAFFTPIGFVLMYPNEIGGGFALADGSRIALQWCILISVSLVLLRLSEVIFVRTRMKDR